MDDSLGKEYQSKEPVPTYFILSSKGHSKQSILKQLKEVFKNA